MFFILSKVLLFLIVPFFWIVILLIWLWFSKNQRTRKRLRITVILLAVVFTNPFIYNSFVKAWQPSPTVLPVNTHYSAGIVLGGLAGYDKNKKGYFGDDADRFIATANLYHQGFINKIIVSGGTGKLNQDEPAEAFFLTEQFIANGIKESDIIIESRSRNTHENGVFTKQIIDSLHLQPPFILITSAMHMKRSVSVFTKNGVGCIPFPCAYKVVPQTIDIGNLLVPSTKVLNDWTYFLKEIVGYYVYKLTGKA
ncbi:MAG: YdcF family protein [Bacteroidota bacterium]